MSKSTSSKFGTINIAITQGEATGIGPEIIAKAIEKIKKDKTLAFSIICTKKYESVICSYLNDLNFENIFFVEPVIQNLPCSIVKNDALMCLYYGAKLAMDKQVDAIVTAPVDKNKIAKDYADFSGHTGFLKSMTNSSDVLMFMSTPSLKVGILTEHIALSSVNTSISQQKIIKACVLIQDYFYKSTAKKPVIGVLALNPHAGDNGIIGSEEADIIVPALQELKKMNINVIGPIPADAAFMPVSKRTCNVYLAMYHDQGMIPVKAKGLDNVVNISLGLPIIRTSPGHGVAYDIVGKNIASPKSLLRAIDEASTMVLSKRLN